jgi:hypothetical protein
LNRWDLVGFTSLEAGRELESALHGPVDFWTSTTTSTRTIREQRHQRGTGQKFGPFSQSM